MTRKPDLPCAGCGKLLWRGSRSLPLGQARCHDCRRAALMAICPVCDELFQTVVRSDKGATAGRRTETCGQYCNNIHQIGGVFDPKLKAASALEHDHARVARRRKLIKEGTVEKFTRLEIFERDGWICHICKDPVDKTLSGRSPMGATIDHLISLFDGGEHSKANVALAHNSCNAKRGNANRLRRVKDADVQPAPALQESGL